LGSHKRMAMSMNTDSVETVANELGSFMKAKPPTSFKEAIKLLCLRPDLRRAKPKTVKSGPGKDVIQRFDAPASATSWPSAPDVNQPSTFNLQPPTLLNLPTLRCWPLRPRRQPACNFQPAPPNVPKPAHPALLAARCWPFHRPALRRHPRSRY